MNISGSVIGLDVLCARYDEDERTYVHSVARRVHRLTLLEPRGKAVSLGEQLNRGNTLILKTVPSGHERTDTSPRSEKDNGIRDSATILLDGSV